MTVRIALTMIVKKEAAALVRCLASVRDLVDEIVVVDTGSHDGTPDLARQHAANVIAMPWSDSFAVAYNAFNEMTSSTNPLGQTTYGYNAVGEQTSVTDPLGNITATTYDAQGRPLTVTAPNGGVTKYAYDLAGNETSITDPVGNVTSYAYDAANELTTTTNPQGYTSSNTYNAAGELTSATDYNGNTIDYAYNANGQETSQTWVGGNYTATYAYNADGEMTSAGDPFSLYTYTYNALGQQTSVSNAGTPGVPTVTLSYTYDEYGNRTSLTDSLGGNISYAYNADNQMTSLSLSVNGSLDAQVTMAYDSQGNLTGMTRTAPSVGGDTISTSYSYDQANELTNITHTDTTKNTTLASYTYGYNAGGQLTNYQDNGGNSLTYGYDANGELTSATGSLAGSNYTFGYNYDLNGNRTSTSTNVNGSLTSATYTTGTGNELLNDGTYSYTYDKNGNTLTQTNLATGSVTYYSWDYENRLTEVKVENSQGQVLNDEKFTYDVFGNRIGVALNGTQTLYTVYDGSNPYMDFNGSGQLTERYLTNPNALSQFYGQVNASGTTQWFLTDNLGSIRQVISVSGSSLDAITYDPYGNILSLTNAANAPRFLYAGGAFDPITGTNNFGPRQENPLDGRWESPDPLSFASGDANLYRYVSNEPTNETDPTGLFGRRRGGWGGSPGFCPTGGYGKPIFVGPPVFTGPPIFVGPPAFMGPPVPIPRMPGADEPFPPGQALSPQLPAGSVITRHAGYGPFGILPQPRYPAEFGPGIPATGVVGIPGTPSQYGDPTYNVYPIPGQIFGLGIYTPPHGNRAGYGEPIFGVGGYIYGAPIFLQPDPINPWFPYGIPAVPLPPLFPYSPPYWP